ncbi:MAG: biotin/lipoate A/B protein ligase family protein [Streptosporangiaceae bacterium]
MSDPCRPRPAVADRPVATGPAGGRSLRVLDFGTCPPLRSQTLWHALGYGVSAGAPTTLSFTRPAAPYVCTGFHRDLAEIDLDYCSEHGLPVYRRMAGGGPVYLDSGQLFFQICLPASAVPPVRGRAMTALLKPAVMAFRAAGVDARLDDHGEICAAEAKICGHAAVQIEEAVIVCGNLIERFDHERATAILALPDAEHAAWTRDLMSRYVAATPVDPARFRHAVIAAYSAALDLQPAPGELTDTEQAALGELDQRFADPAWTAGRKPARTAPTAGLARAGTGCPDAAMRRVKVRGGVWTFSARHGGAGVVGAVIGGVLARVRLSAAGMDALAEQALTGQRLGAAADVLAGYGPHASGLAKALAAVADRRLSWS